LAKSVYDRLFSWVIKKVNENIFSKNAGRRAVIGVLGSFHFILPILIFFNPPFFFSHRYLWI